MKEFIIAILMLCIFATAFSVGLYSLEKYKKDGGISKTGFWKGLLIVFGYAVFSILIIPVAIAEWAVDTVVNFKEE